MAGGDKILQSRRGQLPAQAVDVDRQGVLVHKAVRLPQGLHQLLPADHLPRPLHKAKQDAVLVFRQVDGGAAVLQLLCIGVQAGAPARRHRRLHREVVGPAQQGLHLGHQHVPVKGFGNKVVGAHVHGHDDVHVVRRRGQEDDGHAAAFSDLAAPVVAVEKRQGDVQQDQVRVVGRRLLRHAAEIRDAAGLQRPVCRLLADGLRDGSVVLHDENTVHGSPSLSGAMIAHRRAGGKPPEFRTFLIFPLTGNCIIRIIQLTSVLYE